MLGYLFFYNEKRKGVGTMHSSGDDRTIGKTKILYRVHELFQATLEHNQIILFSAPLPLPLGQTTVTLLTQGGGFDLVARFRGSLSQDSGTPDPLLLMERFARPYGPVSCLRDGNIHIIRVEMRDFVLSYEPRRKEFCFSTSVALLGIDAILRVTPPVPHNGIFFVKVTDLYIQLLRELIDFVYHSAGLNESPELSLRAPSQRSIDERVEDLAKMYARAVDRSGKTLQAKDEATSLRANNIVSMREFKKRRGR